MLYEYRLTLTSASAINVHASLANVWELCMDLDLAFTAGDIETWGSVDR